MPAGGSDATGARHYVEAAREALAAAQPKVRLVVTPMGSSGTLAGLAGLGEAPHCSRSGGRPAGGDVLFLHTGGLPAVFAYEEELA